MKKTGRRILWLLLIALVVMQFIQPDKTNPVSEPEADFIHVNNLSFEDASLLKRACYDCHSNHTKWPWYSSVAPISYVVANHVDEGRGHLNFSVWSILEPFQQSHKLEECVEEVEHGEMPMWGYVALHSEAELTDAEVDRLLQLFESLQ